MIDFKPDWDMIEPYHERIKELEIENENLLQSLNVEAINISESCVDENEKREHEYYVYREALEGLSSAVHDFKIHTNIYCGKAPSDAFVTLYAAPPRTGKPVAWVRDLTSPQPHCVTSLKYLSIADTDAGVKYIPVYTALPSKPWVSLTDEEIDYIWGISPGDYEDKFAFPRAIEAALRSKNI